MDGFGYLEVFCGGFRVRSEQVPDIRNLSYTRSRKPHCEKIYKESASVAEQHFECNMLSISVKPQLFLHDVQRISGWDQVNYNF